MAGWPWLQQSWVRLPPAVRATCLMLFAMFFFTSMSIFIRLSAEELHAMVVVFWRNFLAVVLLVPWLVQRGRYAMRTRRLPLIAARSVVNVIGMAAGFTAITLIPLAQATSLGFTAPLWTTLGAVLVLGEVIRFRRMAALLAGFAGVLIVLRPGFEELSTGAVLALANAFLLAITTLIVKRLTTTEHPEAIVAWMVILQSPLALVPALFVWDWPSVQAWIWLFALAGAGTIGHVCWTRAVHLGEVTQLQPLEFTKLPLIALLAFVVFAEVPTVWTWLGGTLIFAATGYISLREAQLARERRHAGTSP
ncbi:MAG: DMT family transporter [Pseudomonadota bacterium]